MKILISLSIVVTVAASVVGFVSGQNQAALVSKCMRFYFFEREDDGTCVNYTEAIQCLKNVTSKIKDPPIHVDSMIKYVLKLKADGECPAFTKRNTCVSREIRKCKLDFIHTDRVKRNNTDSCKAVPKVRVCLEALQEDCNPELFKSDIRHMQYMENVCDAGYYGNGPCTFGAIRGCSQPEWDHYRATRTCSKDLFIQTTQCLKRQITQCKTEQLKELANKQIERDTTLFCGRNKSKH